MAGPALVDLRDLFPWWSPNVPDLGRFVRRKHELESYDWNFWTEFSPWEAGGVVTHQVYARVLSGEAGWYQRARAVMLPGNSDAQLANVSVPDFVLGGSFVPQPSNWIKFPIQAQDKLYWFIGEHQNPAGGSWMADKRVGHTFDIYDNGTLSTVKFDDTGGDMDQDDLILEVAVVRSRPWFDKLEVAGFSAEARRFESGQFREIQERSRLNRKIEAAADA